MDANKILLSGYENTELIDYNDPRMIENNSVCYDDLPKLELDGVLKACFRGEDGRLRQIYTPQGNHVGVIAATRMGKTTSFVIPTILSFAKQKRKKSMFISDPKGEIFRLTSEELKNEGYDTLLLNLRDALHSEHWNPLTPIYRSYHAAYDIYNEVEAVKTDTGIRNRFRGKIYESQKALDEMLYRVASIALDDVGNDIEALSTMMIPVENHRDPYWENSAKLVLQSILWGMLEDSREESRNPKWPPITEETFSFSTIFTVFSAFKSHRNDFEDLGYFTGRSKNSMAYMIAKDNFIDQADNTRKNIICIFTTKMAPFRESKVRSITSCNSFEVPSIIEKPTAVFIEYKDELEAHYRVISLFVQDAYSRLITIATGMPNGCLDIPFYFILDEFGNFPCIENFKTSISASAGRNVFFILIIQSFAQLDEVYGKETAMIIRDNLNVQIMLGTNNPNTLEEFSKGCGEYTRISPLSALNGVGPEIDQYQIETIRRVPKSMLAHFEPGECVVTEANCGYVMWSMLERYYKCQEFCTKHKAYEGCYESKVDSYSEKYLYDISKVEDSDDEDFGSLLKRNGGR